VKTLSSGIAWARQSHFEVAAATGLIGFLVLLGWTFNLDFLKRIVPGLVAMNPMSATAFVFTAISIALFSGGQPGRQTSARLWFARACAGLVGFVGTAKLIAVFGGPDLGLDRWLFSSKLAVEFQMPNVMAPNTAFNFLLVGIALLCLHSQRRRLSAWACIFALVCGFQSLLAVLGYAYGIKSFYRMTSFIPMALHTAIAFLLVTFGIMSCQANRGFLAIISGNNVGGAIARRLLPAAILVPAVLGWLQLEGQRHGIFHNEFGTALYAVTNMLVFAGLIACNAYLLFRSDAQRTRAERRLRRAQHTLERRVQERTEELSTANAELLAAGSELEARVRERTGSLAHSEERYRVLFESNPFAVWVYDTATLSFLAVNDAAIRRYGYSRDEFLAMTLKDIGPLEEIPDLLADLTSPSADREGTKTWQHRTKAGSIIDVEVKSLPISFGGKAARLVLANDVTARKRGEDELRRMEKFLDSIVENIPDMIFVKEAKELRFVRLNKAGQELLALAKDQVLGKTAYDLFPKKQADCFTEEDRLVLEKGQPVDIAEEEIATRNGRRLLHTKKIPILNEKGEPAYLLGVSTDITEQVRGEKALKQAKEEADRANRAKSEFLSRMSHELRTPMNAILGFAQLLEMDELSAEQEEGVSHIIRGGRHLLDLINEILDLSRIEAGRMSLSSEPVEVSEVLRETIELVGPLAAGREVRLITPAGCDHYVLADRQRLKQVLINLVSNSIKYNRPGGLVTLTCDVEGHRVRISVIDTGIGIPAERLAELFTPFERLGAERSDIEGTGLGLAVSKGLVEAMEGAMGVESGIGQGTTFWIEFPLTESPLVSAQVAEEEVEIPSASSGEKHRVLYIEDNLSNLRLIERVLLRRPAIELLAARTGVQGLEVAGQHFPDLILLDLNLPDIDGREVLQRLKTDPRCSAIPVVVLSADAIRGQRDRLLRAGAVEYLTKPLNVKKFLQVLDQTLDGAVPLEANRNSSLSPECNPR
jgi:PAS domain S-box-containing protein